MQDSMKDYKEVLIILDSQATADSKCNKLLKIAINTEDETLKGLTKEMAQAYKLYIKPMGGYRINNLYPKNHTECVQYIAEKREPLVNYINYILGMQKPQWQILAERNGWHK